MCSVLLPPGINPIAVNKYINHKQLKRKKLISMQTEHHFRSNKTDCFQILKEHTNTERNYIRM